MVSGVTKISKTNTDVQQGWKNTNHIYKVGTVKILNISMFVYDIVFVYVCVHNIVIVWQ